MCQYSHHFLLFSGRDRRGLDEGAGMAIEKGRAGCGRKEEEEAIGMNIGDDFLWKATRNA